MAWEVFCGAVDQWNMNGGYDFTLGIKLMELFGLTAPEILEAVEKIRFIANNVRAIQDESDKLKKEREAKNEAST